jgi:lipid-A-disaccharide synthase
MSGPDIFMVAGEPSGDLHGSRLAEELASLAPNCRLRGIGGQKMAAAGVELIYSLEDFAFMGFSEVLKHLPFIRRVFRELGRLLERESPDLVILIDYPGFNIRLAKMARKRGIPVLYYISPQVWAWQPRRAGTIARWVDTLAVVLPFEQEFYRQTTGMHPHFVGHPLLEVIHPATGRDQFCQRWSLDPSKPILGLLPGSRIQEVKKLLPTMLTAGRRVQEQLPDVQVAIGGLSDLPGKMYRQMLEQQPEGEGVRLVLDRPHDLMQHAHLLLVASGTATLEAAIVGTPMVILYRVSFLSWLLALFLVRIRSIGLVNLVAGERIVPELIQHQATPDRVAREALALMQDGPARRQMIEQLARIPDRLGTKGASRRTAELALELLAKKE